MPGRGDTFGAGVPPHGWSDLSHVRSSMSRIFTLALLGCAACATVPPGPDPLAAGSTLAAAPVPAAQSARFEAAGVSGGRWFKGNTHAHTLESDGDSPPEQVARWYRDH